MIVLSSKKVQMLGKSTRVLLVFSDGSETSPDVYQALCSLELREAVTAPESDVLAFVPLFKRPFA